MKKLILLTTLFLAFACSKEDEPGETFLDKYNGTSWTEEEEVINGEDAVEGDALEVVTFSNGTYFYNYYLGGESYLEEIDSVTFGEEEFECIQYKEGTNNFFGLEMVYTFLKNEPNEFLVEYTYLGVRVGTIKITPKGENLVMTETSIGEEGEETETNILIPSDSSYSDYCN